MATQATRILTIVALLSLVGLTTLNPIFPKEQFLQHIGTLLLLLPLFWSVRSGRLSACAFAGLALFTCLHIIGARWIYSFVPYVEWAASFGWDWASEGGRNHYDRLVHFSFGLLLFPACYDVLKPKLISRGWAVCVAWLAIQTGSLVYELFEWGLTFALSPDAVEGYNGQQGDMWDAQKDMALALLGSSLSALAYIVADWLRKHL